jgi:hypothetical protein
VVHLARKEVANFLHGDQGVVTNLADETGLTANLDAVQCPALDVRASATHNGRGRKRVPRGALVKA